MTDNDSWERDYKRDLLDEEMDRLRADLAAANQRAEDAELVAWGLARVQHAMADLPYIFWDADGWHIKVSYNSTLLFCTRYYPTLTPDARAALKAARKEVDHG